MEKREWTLTKFLKRQIRILLINQALFGSDTVEQLKALISLSKYNDQDLGWLLKTLLDEKTISALAQVNTNQTGGQRQEQK